MNRGDIRAFAAEIYEDAASRAIQEIYSQREEVLRAFIAKYGFEPENCMQVTQLTADGFRWWLERRP